MDPKFKIGDVVKLNSGGADMVITSMPTDADPRYRTEWHDTTWASRVGLFAEAVLSGAQKAKTATALPAAASALLAGRKVK